MRKYIAKITFMAPFGLLGFTEILKKAHAVTKELISQDQNVGVQKGNKNQGFSLYDQMAQYGRISIYDISSTEQLNAICRIIMQQLIADGIKEKHIKVERKEKPKPKVIKPDVVGFRTRVHRC